MRKKKPQQAPLAAPWDGSASSDGEAEDQAQEAYLAEAFRPGKIAWLWKSVIPFGGLTFMDGDPGSGKSSILFDLAARVTRGRAMPDGSKGVKGDVLLMLGEDDPGLLAVPRLRAAGADLARVRFFGHVPGKFLADVPRFPAAAETLHKLLTMHRSRLVIVDPYMSFLAPGLSAYVEQDVRLALGPLAAVGQATGVAVVCSRHPTKNTSQKKIYRGGGSVGITAIARSVLWTTAHATRPGRKVLSVIKANLAGAPPALEYSIEAKGDTSVVAWHGAAQGDEEDAVTQAEETARRSVFDEAQRLLRAALGKGPKPAKELLREAEENGIGSRTLATAKVAMAVKSRRKQGQDGKAFWEWSLPPVKGG